MQIGPEFELGPFEAEPAEEEEGQNGTKCGVSQTSRSRHARDLQIPTKVTGGKKPWRKWGPYLSERQWGTVREDYSQDGNAWDYFTHDQARSRAYHWGEDGLAGISDEKQLLCFSVALWNGKDPILKERMFGLTNSEGNHGEDVKEYYFYLDSTPTHSYMKYLYKYPQAAYPYGDLIETNRRRNRGDMEYELLDTGIFNEDRYFDVFVEYAKQSPEDILIQISVVNRGPEPATLHVLPTLWFRNTWTWWPGTPKPSLKQVSGQKGAQAVAASHADLGERYLYCEGDVPLLFTENETNNERIFGTPNASSVRQRRNQQLRGAGKARRRQPRENGDEICRTLSVECGCGKDSHHPSAAQRCWRLLPWAIRSRALLKSCRPASVRRTSSTKL